MAIWGVIISRLTGPKIMIFNKCLVIGEVSTIAIFLKNFRNLKKKYFVEVNKTVQILDNETITEYKRVIKKKWNTNLSIISPKHPFKKRSWTSHSYFQSTLHSHTRRRWSWFPKKFMGPLTPSDGSKPQPSLAGNPRTFQIILGVLSRPFQLLSHTTRTPRM